MFTKLFSQERCGLTGCVASSADLLELNVLAVTGSNFRQQIVPYHGAKMDDIHSDDPAGLIFKEIWTDNSTKP